MIGVGRGTLIKSYLSFRARNLTAINVIRGSCAIRARQFNVGWVKPRSGEPNKIVDLMGPLCRIKFDEL